MKEFTDKFIQTLVYNVATIAAIVVAIVQFMIRAYKENNGTEKVRKVTVTVLAFVDNILDQIQQNLNQDMPVAEVSTKSTKRTRKVQ